jgi:hypothetical protein
MRRKVLSSRAMLTIHEEPMDSVLFRAVRAALFPLLLAGSPLAAQRADSARAALPDSAPAGPAWTTLRTVGGGEEDRERVLQLLGREPHAGFLIRSPSSRTPRGEPGSFALLRPEARIVYNSGLPYSLNEGGLWAGRGAGVLVTGGFRARAGRFRLTVAPELARRANADFQTLSPGSPDASRYASPFHFGGNSPADLPLRFGDDPQLSVSLGQSSAVAEVGRFDVGVAKESQWWGPAIRNALVMSNNAPGIPHFFARTGVPLRTRIGEVDAKWVVGSLRESGYFDRTSRNDVRALSALAVAWRPVWEPNLTLGATRAAYASAGGAGSVPAHAFDVLLPGGEDRAQVFSVFTRWLFPASGVEAYGEWVRQEGLATPRLWLSEELEPWGYTLGLQWARPTSASAIFRLQVEVSDLEKGVVETNGTRVRSYYTGAQVPQGYTHRGRVLGAAIGPGASSQWIAGDHLGARWEAGAFAGRVRWDNDALYQTFQPNPLGHDVTALLGVRGALRTRGFRFGAELTAAKRHNYLFQVVNASLENPAGVDIPNRTLRLTVEPLRR